MFTLAKLTNVLDPFTKRKLSEFELNLFKNFYSKDGNYGTNPEDSFKIVKNDSKKVENDTSRQPLKKQLTM